MKKILKNRPIKYGIIGGVICGLLALVDGINEDFVLSLFSFFIVGAVLGVALGLAVSLLVQAKNKILPKNEKVNTEVAKQEKPKVIQTVSAVPIRNECTPQKIDISVPSIIDNCVRLYYYSVNFIPVSNAEEVVAQIMQEKKYELSIQVKENKIIAFYQDRELGEIIQRQDMIKDWLKKKDLIKLYFERYSSDDLEKCHVFIAFYRDEQARLSRREQSVVKLTNYKNEDARTGQIGLKDGALLDFDTDIDFEAPEDTVWITYAGYEIGRLPKKYAKRYIEEGATAVFFDRFETDENYEDIPYVKIYW